MHRLCWSRFADPQTAIVQQYYQLFLEAISGADVPITPPVNLSVRADTAVAGNLQLQVETLLGYTCLTCLLMKGILHLSCMLEILGTQCWWTFPEYSCACLRPRDI